MCLMDAEQIREFGNGPVHPVNKMTEQRMCGLENCLRFYASYCCYLQACSIDSSRMKKMRGSLNNQEWMLKIHLCCHAVPAFHVLLLEISVQHLCFVDQTAFYRSCRFLSDL